VSVGQAKAPEGAEVAQDGGVVAATSVAAGDGSSADSMQAPSPSIPAAKAGAAGDLAAGIASRANTRPAHVQGGQSPSDGVSAADPDRMEERRMGALMEDSVSVAGRSGPVHHTKAAQQRSGVSTGGGGVVPSSPSSERCAGRGSDAVEPQGALRRSFPLGSRPPATP